MTIDDRDHIVLSDARRAKVWSRIRTAEACAKDRQELNDEDKGSAVGTRSERNLHLVAGTYWAKRQLFTIRQVNYLRTALEIKHGIMTSGETEFLISARKPQFRELEDPTQADINNQWSSLEFDKPCDAAYWDSMIHQVGGAVELGWKYKDDHFDTEHGRPEESDIADANVKDVSDEDVPPAFTVTGEPIGVPVHEIGEEPEELSEPDIDDPFVERFDPRDLLIDPACTGYDLTTARYVFRRKDVLLSKVRANRSLHNTGDLKGCSYVYWKSDDPQKRPQGAVVDDITRTDVYDGYCYLDLGKGEQLYHVMISGETHKELLCEPYRIKSFVDLNNPFPFEIMPAIVPDNDSLDGTCDVEAAADLQKNHDRAYTQVEKARAQSPNIVVAREELFEGDEGKETRRKLELGVENIVLTIPSTIAAGDAIHFAERPPIHQDAFKELESIPAKILGVIGVSEFQGSMLPDKQLTATEASAYSAQGSTRQDRELARYQDFVKRVGTKVLLLLQEFTARPREFAFTGIDGKPQDGKVTPEMLRGVVPGTQSEDNPLGDLHEPGIQFSIAIDVSKKRPRNQVSERNDLIALLKELAPLAQMPDPRLPTRPLIDIPSFLRAIIKRTELTDIDNVIPPAPTDQEKQQAAMQAMQQAQGGGPSGPPMPGGGPGPGGPQGPMGPGNPASMLPMMPQGGPNG